MLWPTSDVVVAAATATATAVVLVEVLLPLYECYTGRPYNVRGV